MWDLKNSLINLLNSQHSSPPQIYGQETKEAQTEENVITQTQASEILKAAQEVALAANYLQNQQGNNQEQVEQASALLERKLSAMEAVISIKQTEDRKDVQSDIQKQLEKQITYQPPPAPTTGPAAGNGFEVMLQQFNWESKRGNNWFQIIKDQAKTCHEQGISCVWFPPCTNSVSEEGYLPRDLYDLNSRYGNESELREAIAEYHKYNITVIADIVINHRCASAQKDGVWNQFGGRMAWDETAVCCNNGRWKGRGGNKTGDDYVEAPNVDHTNPKVQNDLKEWMNYLKGVGFDSWRFDFVKGYGGNYVKDYINSSTPYMAFGEFWDSCDYQNGVLAYNQDGHRQRTINWIDATEGTSAAFDFTTKGILQEAVSRVEYWRLVDNKGRCPGVIGMWPSRAITFLENHDTGSTLNHWPFPYHGLQQGYAYLLTHPGTPCVFYDHFWSKDHALSNSIKELIRVRREQGINYKSSVDIKRAHGQVYSCVIDNKVCMKIGPGDWHPGMDNVQVGQKDWKLECYGHQFAVWSAVM